MGQGRVFILVWLKPKSLTLTLGDVVQKSQYLELFKEFRFIWGNPICLH